MPAISKRRREYLRSVLLVPATPRQRETRSRDTLRLLQAQQTFPHYEEVRQGAGDDQSMGVLRQAAITHLGEPEDAFDHADRMLDLGPHPRLLAIRGPLGPAQDLLAARFALSEILRVGRTGAEHRRLPGVGGVAPHPALAAVQQPGQRLTVVHVGRGDLDRMNELALAIDAEVPFHPEVPLLAFLGLMHLRIAGRSEE